MAWIKRNLFFVVGGVIALALLGGAGFYIWQGWSHNSEAFDKLSGVVGQLTDLTGKTPSPGTEKINNTQIARDQNQQLQVWITNAETFFQPIPAIPPDANVDGARYSTALQKTIDQLQHEADTSQVQLPPKFEFSFTAEKDRMTFVPAGLNPLAGQLGEVKAISEILFAARINALDSIQRVRVSDDDASGAPGDYIDGQPVTNDLAVITPYVLSIHCFTAELAGVITGFATSPSAFIVKSVNVDRGTGGSASGADASGNLPPGAPPPPMMQPVPGKGGLPTILKEQLLHVTLEVDLVKLLPKT
jgi:hypothetical protein